MQERPFPAGLEFLDAGQSRRAIVLGVLAFFYVGIWAALWPRHLLSSIALGLVATVLCMTVFRFLPTFLVRLDASQRECLVEWKVGHLAKRRVIPFGDVTDIERTDSPGARPALGATGSGPSRLEFVLRDGTRMPWTDYHSPDWQVQEEQRRKSLALIRETEAAARRRD